MAAPTALALISEKVLFLHIKKQQKPRHPEALAASSNTTFIKSQCERVTVFQYVHWSIS